MPPRAILLAASLCTAIAAQTPFAVGTRAVSWSNPTTQGSVALAATVRYPAINTGVNVPILPHAGGWPVIVFQHGLGWLGSQYVALGDAWASAGYVVVMSDTCQFDWGGQPLDGIALYHAVHAASAPSAGPFAGAFDTQKVALAGHSMGGGNTATVLATNPGYSCGLVLAPATWLQPAANVTVPFGIVVGLADTITPPALYSEPLFDGVAPQRSLKFLYVFDNSCEHMALAGIAPQPWSTNTTAVFQRTVSVSLGFFAHCFRTDPRGLESVIGATARAEPRLSSLQRQTTAPQMWVDRAFKVGTTTTVTAAVEGSVAVLFAAGAAISPVTLSIGTLEIDPSVAFVLGANLANPAHCVEFVVNVPADPLLSGVLFGLQAIGESPATEGTLSNPVFMHVLP